MNKILIFMLGATVGSLVTWKFVEKKYKRIADEEIESVKEIYKKREETLESIVDGIKERSGYAERLDNTTIPISDDEVDEFNSIIEKRYSPEDLDDEDCIVKVDNGEEIIEPYVISPSEYGETGNEMISLMLYADGIVADDYDHMVDEYEHIIGDALDHMGEFEDECVHVRNENTGCDYEILMSQKTFDEIIKGD